MKLFSFSFHYLHAFNRLLGESLLFLFLEIYPAMKCKLRSFPFDSFSRIGRAYILEKYNSYYCKTNHISNSWEMQKHLICYYNYLFLFWVIAKFQCMENRENIFLLFQKLENNIVHTKNQSKFCMHNKIRSYSQMLSKYFYY